jgi:SAM-dependent methyltransferase
LLDKAETFLADPERADVRRAVRLKDEPRAARQHRPPLSVDPKNPAVTPSAIKMLLPEPSLQGLEGGSREWFAAQLTVIRMRPLVRRTYEQWYSAMLADARSVPDRSNEARVIEIGSGAGYVKTIDPSVITSDIVPGNTDMTIDAQALPFESDSLRAILLTHVFHHIPDVRCFFAEAARTLVKGGVISMIEVADTPLARLLFGRFHPEDYRADAADWALDSPRPLGGANQALSWIVFFRDRDRFEREVPELKVECIERLPWLGYLLSGGVTRRNLIPNTVAPVLAGLDRVSAIANPLCALHWHIRLRRA